tara:strand:+ start:6511 stop:6993 length:483 start_codon:yes stop_codon:yes gene_type:complete
VDKPPNNLGKSGHRVVEANISHIKHLVDNLRDADLKEVKCFVDDVKIAFTAALFQDDLTYTVLDNNNLPYVMFGAGTNNKEHYIWMLGTYDVEKHKRVFTRHCREWVNYLVKKYGKVYNYVHVENKLSIKWLMWCGATFDEPFEFNGNMFRKFTIKGDRL